ncbi:MAG: dual specificity protein phosphatase family protein [Armatimonadetes bacterium]|nr:dual specificity protein phosphatase family protein [Armatimonadota bacterium]
MEPHEVDHGGRPFNSYEDEFRRLAAEAGGAGRCLRFPIRDVSVPSPAAMRGILDAIDLALDAGQPVYLHCWGGRGRTGTVVGCWLVRHNFATAASALDQIRRLRAGDPTAGKPSPETAAQRQMVTTWAAGR